MKRNLLYLFLIVAVTFNTTSCTKDFEKINIDPNRIDQISPGTLLNPIIFNMASFNMQRADAITFNLMQVALPYPSASGGIHRYDIQESTGNSAWSTSYLQLNNVRALWIRVWIHVVFEIIQIIHTKCRFPSIIHFINCFGIYYKIMTYCAIHIRIHIGVFLIYRIVKTIMLTATITTC